MLYCPADKVLHRTKVGISILLYIIDPLVSSAKLSRREEVSTFKPLVNLENSWLTPARTYVFPQSKVPTSSWGEAEGLPWTIFY